MFEEDVRSEQFESNTFKPRYPVFLNDGEAPLNGSASNGPPLPPPTANNLYPPTPAVAVTPTPPRAAVIPSAPPSSIPSAVMPSPPPPVNQPSNNKSGPSHQPSVEVLGFSIPPDYEPTETDPALNIGWK